MTGTGRRVTAGKTRLGTFFKKLFDLFSLVLFSLFPFRLCLSSTMDYTSRDPDVSADFSDLNSRLRPRLSSSEQLYCSLSRVQSRPARQRLTLRRTASLSEPEDDGPDASDGPGADSRNLAGMSLMDAREGTDSDSGPGARSTSQQGRSESPTSEGGESPFQRSYMSLPDLINGGRPLGRRRTLGHVNDTLNEIRREVELSRRRSIKLKAQVDKLQESRHGPGWSRDRERVTEEILSILRLMQLMPEHQGGRPPDPPPPGKNCLDAALAQLQDIARKMAVSGIAKKDAKSPPGASGSEDGALLQQALRDRDDAIEKKKAMETELLRSKSEMMLLNNQLLEAAQKRLELSLELEAWKVKHEHPKRARSREAACHLVRLDRGIEKSSADVLEFPFLTERWMIR
ncbi:bicaudal-D-related protein 2-like isoform X2 [Phycodurus eques]|uniref:bicaudal-D-related protein 2-like isoform X2 n=1 Tax=Phycodurus eques TaxID=693459 RepID=UPI002ACECFB7|nr:bicaudal-D-related protein 2-like isoform X2 [Phycodurus eques]